MQPNFLHITHLLVLSARISHHRHAAHLTKDKAIVEEAPPSPVKAVRANPLVTLVDTVVDEAVLLFIRGVACQVSMSTQRAKGKLLVGEEYLVVDC